jgi:TolB protein
MDADGSDQRRLVQEPLKTSAGANWSPDGRSFVFSMMRGEAGADIYLASADGSIQQRLTEDDAHNGAVGFSPDGQRIAFYSDRDGVSDIVVMNRDGSGREVVVTGGKNYYPRWSPDGQWLVYTAVIGDGHDNLDVYAVSLAGRGEAVPLVTGPGREGEARWRPRP